MSITSGPLNGHAHFFHWGVVQISAANLIVIVIMIVLFGLAVLLRLPGANRTAQRVSTDEHLPAGDDAAPRHAKGASDEQH